LRAKRARARATVAPTPRAHTRLPPPLARQVLETVQLIKVVFKLKLQAEFGEARALLREPVRGLRVDPRAAHTLLTVCPPVRSPRRACG
jgi:hypothetical protein